MAVNTRHTLRLMIATFIVATSFAGEVKTQSNQENEPEITAPLEPLRQGIAQNQLFTELEARNELRKAALLDYTVRRTYQVADLKGKVHAEEIGQMEFHAPDQKNFAATSETGSGLIRRMALTPLISSEIEAAAGKVHHDSAISPANYSLELLGEQQVGTHRCFVAKAIPKRKEKYLFEGKVWIDADDYAIVRIEGHPAKKLSFWIERAEFVRQYQKIDGFWLPEKDQTLVQVRMYGKKVLTIEHQNYVVNASQNSTAQNTTRRPLISQARVPASADEN
ncbi:MAG TPA: outer membrane lipoprotein-sorting protein [Terriglobales bacterium]|nr:outer membrane lipoprotein-sorting protein [Terriglobales bacterium]